MQCPPAAGGLPTRSEIENWDTADLDIAAAVWRQSATASERAFEQHRQNIAAPGGTTWEGDAKDAALDRATADVAVVGSQGDVLRRAADIAVNGNQDIQAAKRKAVEAIAEAEQNDFRVGEDLSVTDTRRVDPFSMAGRHTSATEYVEDIRWNAEQLVQAENLVRQRLQEEAVELDGIRFDGDADGSRDETVQLVDNKLKLGPEIDDPAGSDNPVGVGDGVQRHPDFSDHRPDGRWAPADSGVDGDAAMNKTFDDMEAAGTHLERQRIHVFVTDPETGEKLRREYDALQPTGVPGQYIGIEHKTNQSPITANQRTVDDLVRSGVAAQGTLNGQPIEVTDVDVVRIPWPPPEVGAPLLPEAAAGAGDGNVPDKVIESAPKGLPDWGTYVPPEELRETDGPLGILQDFRDAFTPPDPHDPDNMA